MQVFSPPIRIKKDGVEIEIPVPAGKPGSEFYVYHDRNADTWHAADTFPDGDHIKVLTKLKRKKLVPAKNWVMKHELPNRRQRRAAEAEQRKRDKKGTPDGKEKSGS